MSCGETFLKSVTGIFTTYFAIVGLAFVIYGTISSYVLLKSTDIDILVEENVAIPSIAVAAFGTILLVTVIVGCCAVCREIPSCMETYSIILIVLALSQIVLGVFALLNFAWYKIELADSIDQSMDKMFSDYDKYHPAELDNAQNWLGCCGVNSPYDWDWPHKTLPLSCCSYDVKDNCTLDSISKFTDGCRDKLFNFVIGTNMIIGWACIAVAATEFLAAFVGIGLSCSIWRKNRTAWI